jgi:HSP20 family protein
MKGAVCDGQTVVDYDSDSGARGLSAVVVPSAEGIPVRKPRIRSCFFLPAVEARASTVWQPQVDIYRAPEGWVIKMELAGVRPQDVSLTVRGAQLSISGVRYDRIVEAGWSHYTMEIAYHRFERTLALPCDLEHARITVEGRDGMLLLRIVTKEESDNV